MWDFIIKKINKHFLITYHLTEKPNNTSLISAGQYRTLVGDELAYKHFKNAYDYKFGKYTVKLRRGLTINFISK